MPLSLRFALYPHLLHIPSNSTPPTPPPPCALLQFAEFLNNGSSEGVLRGKVAHMKQRGRAQRDASSMHLFAVFIMMLFMFAVTLKLHIFPTYVL